MRISKLILLCMFFSALVGSGKSVTAGNMIVGGHEVPPDKYPFVVRLYRTAEPTDTGFCGGALIDAQWILTAGHCVAGKTRVIVGYGSNDRTKTKKIESEEIIPHDQYSWPDNDIALIKLKAPVPQRPDIPLLLIADTDMDRKLLQPSAKVTVSGWGAKWDTKAFEGRLACEGVTACRHLLTRSMLRTSDGVEFPTDLHEVQVEVIEMSSCEADYIRFNKLRKERFNKDGKAYDGDLQPAARTTVCATDPDGGKDSCFGDSGGPLFINDGKNYWQVGIVSWGPQCGNPLYPGIYMRVSAYKDWINSTLKNQ